MVERAGGEGEEEGRRDALVDGVFGDVDEDEREHASGCQRCVGKALRGVAHTKGRRGNASGGCFVGG